MKKQKTWIVSTRRDSTPHQVATLESDLISLEWDEEHNDLFRDGTNKHDDPDHDFEIYDESKRISGIVGVEARHSKSLMGAERDALVALLEHGKKEFGAEAYELTGLISTKEDDGEGCFGYATAIFYRR